MSISKVRLPNNTEEDIKAKYLIQSTSSDATSAEFSARTVSGDAIANIQKIYGNTVKWNQLNRVQNNSATITEDTLIDNKVTGYTYHREANHKYLYRARLTTLTASDAVYLMGNSYTVGIKTNELYSVIYSNNNTTQDRGQSFALRSYGSGTFGWTDLCIHDLTEMYGAGNEPTVEEFEAKYPASYYPYDPGSLINNSATAIFSRGFNQWDEEWELGEILASTGENYVSSQQWRSKNYIPILSNSDYYSYAIGISNKALRPRFYDVNYTYIGYQPQSGSSNLGNIFKTPIGARYMRFALNVADVPSGTNICIDISDTAKNGTYEPYNGHQIDLNIPTLTGKLNGAGSSVVIFPDGMKKAGTVYDEIVGNKAIKRVGSEDLGTLTWSMVSNASYPNRFQAVISGIAVTGNNLIPGYTNKGLGGYGSAINEDKSFDQNNTTINIHDSSYSTAESFNTAMSGVMLYYELATPEEYILDNVLQLQYPVVAGGTEMVLPTIGTAPMKMDVIYGNAADATSNLSSNFISVDSMKAFLNNLGTQMGGTWNMQYNNGKFEFTFSSG